MVTQQEGGGMAVVVVHVAEQWGATGGKGGKGQQPKLIITSQWDYAEEGERKGEDRNPHTRVVKEGCSQSRANAWADNAQIFFFFFSKKSPAECRKRNVCLWKTVF